MTRVNDLTDALSVVFETVISVVVTSPECVPDFVAALAPSTTKSSSPCARRRSFAPLAP